MKRHPRRPPDVPELIDLLNRHKVHFVIVGSVAAQLYGVKLKPGDFDITPKLSPRNLQRLAQLLLDIEATPESFGHWEVQLDGEKRWVEEQVTPEIGLEAITSPEGKLGEYLGSGDGRLKGEALQGTVRWDLYEVLGKTSC